MGRRKKADMDQYRRKEKLDPEPEDLEEEAEDLDEDPGPPKVWTFISKYKGYSFPDPRSKPPADPHLAMRWMPNIIRFIHGVYQTRDPEEAIAIYNRWKAVKSTGAVPDFQPIDRASAEKYLDMTRPKLSRGAVSIETARGKPEVKYPIPPPPEPEPEPPKPKPNIPMELENEFAPAPSRE